MTLDRLPDLDPAPEEVVDTELAVTDDLLVKAFALGPGAALEAHAHDEMTNVFHVLRGEVVVEQGEEAEVVSAPGVVVNERGQVHGARNEGEAVAVFTATMGPMG